MYHETHGSGPPLVLLHGAAMVAEAWQPLITPLSEHFTLHVPERRGVGRTPDAPGPWTYFDMARDSAAFLDAQGLRGAAVLGYSDGGNIGLILAYSRPDLVAKLAVSGANRSAAGLGAFGDAVRRMTPEQLLASAPAQVVPWLEIQKRVSPDRGADLLRSFEKMRRMWLDYEISAADLARISARTLVMAGDRDMIPVAHTVEIWSAIPDAELCIVPGADHFWLLEKPALAVRTLLAFLLGAPVQAIGAAEVDGVGAKKGC